METNRLACQAPKATISGKFLVFLNLTTFSYTKTNFLAAFWHANGSTTVQKTRNSCCSTSAIQTCPEKLRKFNFVIIHSHLFSQTTVRYLENGKYYYELEDRNRITNANLYLLVRHDCYKEPNTEYRTSLIDIRLACEQSCAKKCDELKAKCNCKFLRMFVGEN
jgi:hypothetical protein